MGETAIQPINAADVSPGSSLSAALLALNNAHAQELSWLEPDRLQHLVREAFYARRIGDLDAFLIAFDQDARYDSPNFLWFRERYPRFVYIDRIVTAAQARGRSLAQRLYFELFEQAARAGHERVVCEINLSPRIRVPMHSMRRWDLPRSAARRFTAAPRRCVISHAPFPNSAFIVNRAH